MASNWEYKDYRPTGFECWEIKVDSYYLIAISKLTDNGTSYTVRLYYKDDMVYLKKQIDAADWDTAKAAAIQVVYDYINGQANYWYSVRERFERVFEVD